jgi:hypothetical protein
MRDEIIKDVASRIGLFVMLDFIPEESTWWLMHLYPNEAALSKGELYEVRKLVVDDLVRRVADILPPKDEHNASQ